MDSGLWISYNDHRRDGFLAASIQLAFQSLISVSEIYNNDDHRL